MLMSSVELSKPAVCAVLGLALVLVLAASCREGKRPAEAVVEVPPPPETDRKPVSDEYFGQVVEDPYRWLEDQQSPATREWIERQNEYTDTVLGQVPGRDELRELATRLLVTDDVSVPITRGGRSFFSRRDAGQDLAVIYVQEADSEPRALIDPHPWSEDHSLSAEIVAVSRSGRLLAYAVRAGGKDEITIRIRDLQTGEDRPDELPSSRYFGLSFKPDDSGFFYTRYAEEGARVLYHELGADPAGDRVVFGEGYDPGKIIWAQLSPDGRYLLATVSHGSSGSRTDLFLDDLRDGKGFQAVVSGPEGRFVGQFAGEQLVVHTNFEAPGGRVLALDLPAASWDQAREIIAERDGVVIEGVAPAGGRLLVETLESVASRLTVHALDGTPEGEVDLGGLVTLGTLDGTWEREDVTFSVSSLDRPETIYSYDLQSSEKTTWWSQDVPFDPEAYTVEQVWYPSKDGTEVPMFLAHRKDLEPRGDVPTLLTGYGGFSVNMMPRFAASSAAWLELGGMIALPSLRGGGELGESWHRDGMLDRKQNTFDDFIAAAEWLVENGYTRPERLGISGGSNGGLLVGAAMVQRPDLFGAVICRYPLLDMLRYHEFLVARFWVPEYGSSEDPDQYEVLRAYSPYHNVVQGTEYPATLFITGDGDTRVAPLHARKMAALVQSATGSDDPVLLRYHTKAGHAGAKPVSQEIDDLVDLLAFLRWQLAVQL